MRHSRLGVNLDKAFPKLSIRAKLLIGFVVLALVPTVVVGGWAAWEVTSGLRARELGALADVAADRARAIEALDASIEDDLRYLAVHPAFQPLLQRPAGGDAEVLRAATESAFLSFSQGRRAYYQVRYIDEAGHEIVRVDYRDGRAVAVPRLDLQDKSDRYYVRAGLARPPGEIYLSPMDLNVEHGRVEEPARPVIRYVLALGQGQRASGLLVVNLFADHLFALLEPLRLEGRAILLDDRGTYLASSDGPAAPFRVLNGRSLGTDESPQVVRGLLSGAGSLLTPSGTAYGFAPIGGRAEAWGRRWVLAVMVPETKLVGTARRAGVAIALGAMLAGGVAALLGALAAWRLSSPLQDLARAAGQVAGGDFSVRVFCNTNDEIEDLASRFNDMTEQLGQAQGALARWNDDLRHAVKQRTAELAQEKEKLEGIVAGMEAGLCLIDRSRHIVWANRALLSEHGEKMIGRTCAEALGCHPHDAYPWDDSFAGRGVVRRLITRPGPDGQERHIQVVAAPVHDAAGEVTHVIELSIDMTESIRREEAVVRSERLSALGCLSAGVLHEVANPLAVIKTSLQALLDGSMEHTRVRRFAERAVAEVDRLGRFLRSFSTFARTRPPEPAVVNLAEVVRDAVALVEGAARSRGLRVELSLRDATVWADGGQVRQVLLNLLLNAIEASPNAGRILVAVRPVTFDGMAAAAIEVADEGPGMDEETRRRIFDPFFSTKPNGTGLGLSLVHQIVTDHGGRVEVETRPGAGARFRVLLFDEQRPAQVSRVPAES